MSLTAGITYGNWVATYPDQNGGETVHADVYISIIDTATGGVANGDYCIVTYEKNDNGNISTYDEAVAGQGQLIYSGLINELRYNYLGELTSHFYIYFRILSVSAGTGETDPPVNRCDLAISSIAINNPESAPGALDGQITINATSSYLPVQYSLDQENYQPSSIFSGLSGGVKTAFARDANGCHTQLSVQLNTLTSLLTSGPSITLAGGNTSHWSAAFNPVVFTYQRKDFGIISVALDTATGYATLHVNAVLNPNTTKPVLLPGDKVYVNAGPYRDVYQIEKVTGNAYITIQTAFTTDAAGFININQMRAYYKVLTRISYAGSTKTIVSTNRPNHEGVVRADISNFLQSLVQAKDDGSYTQINYRDDNLSASYQVAYAEQWDEAGETKTSPYIPIGHNYYVLYAAKQLGERYGGNLAAYVPFTNTPDDLPKAKWITDFAEPAYSNGYPFDIGFIYSEDLLGRELYCEFTQLNINRDPLPGGIETGYLLNEDGSWLLNTDESRLVISGRGTETIPVPAQLGLNRLLINTILAAEVYFINIALKYTDGDTVHTVTEIQTIRVDDAIDDNSVYLRWIGLSGSWNYYRFVFNQEVSLDVQNAVIIKNYVSDWENQQGIEEVISKTAGQKVKVVAEDLSVADIKGLQSIKYSPKVQMLMNKNPVKWQTIVINTATYSEFETRNGRAPFSVTFNMPAINIQTQ